jgi:rod shape determining protein RodA
MEYHYLKRFNWAIFALLVITLAVGVAFIHSASYRMASRTYEPYALKQVVRIAVGFGIFIFLLFPRYSSIGYYSFLLYLACLALLASVFVLGMSVKGASRWISLGSFKLQPSEFVKVAVILVVAKHFSQLERDQIRRFNSLIKPLVLTLIPMALIAIQPDVGTSLILVPITLGISFAAGVRTKHILLVLFAGLVLLPIFYQFLRPYQRGRLLSFINPEREEYKLAEGYQLIQSKAAIGSGGLLGKGWGEGTQNNYNLLPERRTDFVFAVIGEEWGFVGGVFVLFLLFGIIFLCMEVAHRTKDMFGRLVAVGVSVFLFLHVVINVGMTVGLMPVTGVTLPFVSFGGSSLLASFACLSLVINVGMRPVPALYGA